MYESLSITSEQARLVEEKTRKQSNSRIWFQQRAGRITASKFRAPSNTDISQPSKSLIKLTCYPENNSFQFKAREWGCEHEKLALEPYTSQNGKHHLGFNISCSGFVIHTSYPHMGASPDGIVTCECCGCGVLEVKCPFS